MGASEKVSGLERAITLFPVLKERNVYVIDGSRSSRQKLQNLYRIRGMSHEQMFIKTGRSRLLEAELLIAPSADRTPWFGPSERYVVGRKLGSQSATERV